MRYILLGIIISSLFSPLESAIGAKSDCEFVIIIASHNNAEYVENNLKSACSQRSSNPYQVIYINDASTDRTKELVDAYVKKNHLEHKVIVVHNKKQLYYENLYKVTRSLPDHKISVTLDGDDTLAHDGVLEVLESYYADPDIWLTYGTALKVPMGGLISREIPEHIFKEKAIREYEWCSSHLRTYKVGLFKKIKKKDFLYNGKFPRAAADLALMFPMLEMCAPFNGGKNHSVYIPEILYLYQKNNPLSNYRTKTNEQQEAGKYFRSKPPYDPLEKLLSVQASLISANESKKVEDAFSFIYENNYWKDSETKSGIGSNKAATQEIRLRLPKLFKKYGIHSILDIPCGDFNWMSLVDLNAYRYIGGDIVKSLIAKNRELYEAHNREFLHLNAIEDKLPRVDIIYCRDLFVHLPINDIIATLRNFKKSSSKYLLMTTFVEEQENIEIEVGKWRKLNFEKAPFNFPKPIELIYEKSPEINGKDKNLGLWLLKDIQIPPLPDANEKARE